MFGQHNLLAALFIIGSLIDFITGLRLVEVRIPNYVIKGSAAQLECLYDLDGEALYSVKWYKDGNEFYRYVPRDMPPAQTFLLPGVKVDLHNSSDAIVTLRDVNLQSAGRFRCEVSGEAPSFQTVTEHGDMVVVSLPDQGPPKISGGRPRYQTGDWVRINCTAGRSKPAVDLSWFVNGEAVEPQKLRKYDSIVSGREGLETSVLGLQFRVEQKHFRNGDMKLKCVASLSTLYWRSNEESVEGDRPQKAPVLESRETVYASNSRADPVQASKSDSLLLARAPSALLLVALAAVAALAGGGISGPQSINKDHQEDEKMKERKKQRKLEKNLNERVSGVELSELLASELLADFEGEERVPKLCDAAAASRSNGDCTVAALRGAPPPFNVFTDFSVFALHRKKNHNKNQKRKQRKKKTKKPEKAAYLFMPLTNKKKKAFMNLICKK